MVDRTSLVGRWAAAPNQGEQLVLTLRSDGTYLLEVSGHNMVSTMRSLSDTDTGTWNVVTDRFPRLRLMRDTGTTALQKAIGWEAEIGSFSALVMGVGSRSKLDARILDATPTQLTLGESKRYSVTYERVDHGLVE